MRWHAAYIALVIAIGIQTAGSEVADGWRGYALGATIALLHGVGYAQGKRAARREAEEDDACYCDDPPEEQP